MRIFLAFALVMLLFAASVSFTACGGKAPASFCDTTCSNDSIFFSAEHPDKPFVAIGMKNCGPDTITWSHNRLPAKRKFLFKELTGKDAKINKNFIRNYIKDTSYVWLLFNDCVTGQGFMAKIPFNKVDPIVRKNSAINNTDPKYSVADNLAVYADRGNIFVEDMTNGTKATATFGREIPAMDYLKMHETIDSVNITADRVWARYKFENEWQTLDKKITLK